MLTPQEQALIAEIRASAAPTGEDDGRTKSELRRGQRRLLATIDRLAAEKMDAVAMLTLCGELGGKKDGESHAQYLRRMLDALIDAQAACRLLVKWHSSVFDGGKQALCFDNGYPVDRTDVDEAARLAKDVLGEPKRGPHHPMYFLDESRYIVPDAHDILKDLLCDDCPPPNQYTDGVRCRDCPRRKDAA